MCGAGPMEMITCFDPHVIICVWCVYNRVYIVGKCIVLEPAGESVVVVAITPADARSTMALQYNGKLLH